LDFFSLGETKKLIQDYSADTKVQISEEVVQSLYEYTLGYPGLARTIQDVVFEKTLSYFGHNWNELRLVVDFSLPFMRILLVSEL